MNLEPGEHVPPDNTQETVPTYGILIINHAYNQGKITFQEWMRLSHEWALKIKEQYGRAA